MAEAAEHPPALPGNAITDSPLLRHFAVMVGIAASVALGVAVVLWARSPNYTPLYGELGDKDAMEVAQALQQANVAYKVDSATGMILVPTGKLQDVRMRLAAQGLPNTGAIGFEVLQQESGFATSRLVEKARYHHAIEGELARTIATLGAVQSARVHVALPKQSVFVRNRRPPSASVMLRLYSGRTLEPGQVDAIVHLVASAVPDMEPSRVSIIDHKGRLLSDGRDTRAMKLSATQFEHTRKLEAHYQERIADLLAPIIGAEAFRAQVTADIDYTVTEQTQESFNPDQPALRSEQLNEEQSRNAGAQGVPGALANQPPAAGAAPEQAGGAGAEGEGGAPLNTARQQTRNYELDRTVSHVRPAPAQLRRLSVAIVVDDVAATDAEGNPVRRERTPEELDRIAQLVREAIGFSVQRGDTIKVINSSFLPPEPIADLPEVPLWEQPWFWDVVKQGGGVLVAVLMILLVLRPTMKRLTTQAMVPAGEGGALAAAGVAGGAVGDGAGVGEGLTLGDDGQPVRLPGPGHYENVMQAARQMVDEDPKRVAQLVKTWVDGDGG